MKTSRPRDEERYGGRIRPYMRNKLAFSFLVITLALFILVLVIVGIIRNDGEDYTKRVMTQQNYNSTVIPFKRGTITDRNQTVLAASEQVYNVILDPSIIFKAKEEDIEATLDALEKSLGLDRAETKSLLEANKESSYLRLKAGRRISAEKKEAYETYKTEHNKKEDRVGTIPKNAVWFEAEYKRVYPYNTLACTVLGFSGSDSGQGNWGIEQYYNDYLVGTNGKAYGYLASDGTVERTLKEAEDGNTVVTTLDFTIQKLVEEELSKFLETVNANYVGILVMNPNNAEILAMASNSIYNLNDPMDMSQTYSQEEIDQMTDEEKSQARNKMWRNFMISDTYEPGSTAKAFTEAAALEENFAEENTSYYCDGGQMLAGETPVGCSHVHDMVTFKEALAYSCNDAMMQMAALMGKSVFCHYLDLFGMGKLTGIDLPGEASGILHSEDKMSSVDLGTNSFGQNYTVTMLQMGAAYCSILNGGNYYQPHVVKEILSPEGDVLMEVGNNVIRQTISENTSRILREGLQLCVDGSSEYCTGKDARISGYTVGGKTGTAEKYPRGSEKYLMSFVGFTPVENPELMVYVIVDEPTPKEGDTEYTSAIAVQLQNNVMRALLDYMHITSTGEPRDDEPDETEAAAEESSSEDGEESDSEDESLNLPTDEDGEPITQEPFDRDALPEDGSLIGDLAPPGIEESSQEESPQDEDYGDEDSEEE